MILKSAIIKSYKGHSGGDFMRRFDIYDGKSVAVEKQVRVKGRDEPPHTHEFVELVYMTKGNFTHYINGKAYPTARGDLLFINYFDGNRFLYLHISVVPPIGSPILPTELKKTPIRLRLSSNFLFP